MKTLLAWLILSATACAQVGINAGVASTHVLTAPGPAVRGSNISSTTSANPSTISFPAGSASGDLAILFVSGAASSITLPSGWTSLGTQSTGGWTVLACSRVFNSTDITTGSVTAANAFSFDQHMGIVVFVGGVGGVRETETNTGGNVTSITATTSGNVVSSDLGLFWGSQRGGTSLPTITPAGGTAPTLQSASTTNAKSTLASDQAMPGGALTVTYARGGTATDTVAAQVIVKAF
jgi:hypothetical protein